jgi:hypothetical protein
MTSRSVDRVLMVLIVLTALVPRCLGQVITHCEPPPASTAMIQHCIDSTPVGGQLELQPGTYNVDAPILINSLCY